MRKEFPVVPQSSLPFPNLPFNILTKHIDQQLRGLILGLFAPVFFGMAGLTANLSVLAQPDLLALTLGLIAVASLGKFGGAFIGATIGGLSRAEAVALGCSMNARGSTEVIIATIGLSMGLLSESLFTMIVATAVITTLAMPPMLRAALRRLPISAEEDERLKREEFEAKGFVANLERLLIAVDESANGRFASRLAGLLAGVRGIPASVLHVGEDAQPHRHPRKDDASAEAAVQASAAKTAKVEEAEQKMRPTRVEVTSLDNHRATGAAVAFEAQKGYDFLIIGVDKPVGASGEFCPEAERAAGGFDGPMAVVVGRGQHIADPRESGRPDPAPRDRHRGLPPRGGSRRDYRPGRQDSHHRALCGHQRHGGGRIPLQTVAARLAGPTPRRRRS